MLWSILPPANPVGTLIVHSERASAPRRLAECLRRTTVLRLLDLRSFQALLHTCRAAQQAALGGPGLLQLLVQVKLVLSHVGSECSATALTPLA